jgi:hypothetical protein
MMAPEDMENHRAPLNAVLTRIGQLAMRTAQVELAIGATVDGGRRVIHDVVLVTMAPPMVLKAIVSEFPMVCVRDNGLWIPVEMPEE